jgi:hypothetical protein
MKSSEGNLVFPNMLNEQMYSLSRTVEYADYGPTQPQYDIFKMLSDKLDTQLKTWAQLKTDEVPKVGAAIKQLDLPALTVGQAGAL